VLEVHTITGAGDMLCRVVARSNADLQRVIDAIVSAEGVVRSATLISLATQVPYRVIPLVRVAAEPRPVTGCAVYSEQRHRASWLRTVPWLIPDYGGWSRRPLGRRG
jgi:hypothetical protein